MNKINEYPCILIHTCCFLSKSSVWECRITCQSWNTILECKIAKAIWKKIAPSGLKAVNWIPLSKRLLSFSIRAMKVFDGSIYIVADSSLCVISYCLLRKKWEESWERFHKKLMSVFFVSQKTNGIEVQDNCHVSNSSRQEKGE